MSGEIKMNDRTISDAIKKVKPKLQSDQAKLKFLYRVRDDITKVVRGCDSNCEVVIYIDDILDDPIECKVGNGDSRLRITIQSDGIVTCAWTSETWGKVWADVGNTVNDLLKNIVKTFKKDTEGDPMAIDVLKKGSIEYK